MTDEDTSQIHFCKNSPHKLRDLTQVVKGRQPRLQTAKLFERADGKEVLLLDFYPVAKDLCFFWEGEPVALPAQFLDRESWRPAKHPFLLYLKAHFVGHVLEEISSTTFLFRDRSFEWDLQNSEWVFRVPSKKDYRQRLPLWGPVEAKSPQRSQKQDRFEKLKVNVEKDIADATAWLETNRPPIEFFFANPQLWGSNDVPPDIAAWSRNLRPPLVYSEVSRKISLSNLKGLLQRYERKFLKATERLSTLRPIEKSPIQKVPAVEKKAPGPGKRVELVPGLEAWVGRKAVENDELFRSAHSRDVWFHVRGQRGGHVWIRRGQKAFGAKGELSEEILIKAAELAVKNSKAAGSYVAVDYTERRFLKKVKGGEPGALSVIQSKTIFVSGE